MIETVTWFLMDGSYDTVDAAEEQAAMLRTQTPEKNFAVIEVDWPIPQWCPIPAFVEPTIDDKNKLKRMNEIMKELFSIH